MCASLLIVLKAHTAVLLMALQQVQLLLPPLLFLACHQIIRVHQGLCCHHSSHGKHAYACALRGTPPQAVLVPDCIGSMHHNTARAVLS